MEINWVETIVSILSGLAVCIPLVVQLVKYVQKAIKEKNWNDVLKIIMDLMATAEKKFETGADKKEWVMATLESMSSSINYDLDMEVISKLIDDLCAMSKAVNVPEN